jgi:hypothetical protein
MSSRAGDHGRGDSTDSALRRAKNRLLPAALQKNSGNHGTIEVGVLDSTYCVSTLKRYDMMRNMRLDLFTDVVLMRVFGQYMVVCCKLFC